MKTIQNLIYYQFTERKIIVGERAIQAAVLAAVFALLVLPFVLMVIRS